MNYSTSLKDFVLRQVYQRDNESIAHIARINNLPKTTVYTWLNMKNKKPKNTKKVSNKIDSKDRFNLICQYRSLPEKDRGEFIRKHGLFTSDIELWEKEFVDAFDDNEKEKSLLKQQFAKLQNEYKQLAKDLNRKDKAMAELSALVVLKKKAEALGIECGFDEEDLEELMKGYQ